MKDKRERESLCWLVDKVHNSPKAQTPALKNLMGQGESEDQEGKGRLCWLVDEVHNSAKARQLR